VTIDTSRPNTARIYDYWLGGKDNFQVDRDAAEAIRENRPDVALLALENKEFLTRAVGYVAGQGICQFLDIGSGLPTSPVPEPGAAPQWLATHDAAMAVIPDALVAYIDNDPVAVTHSRALLAKGSERVIAMLGDMRDPAAICQDAGIRHAGLNLAEPACVILGCVLHFLDPETALRSVAAFSSALAPGSYFVISVGHDSEESPDRDFAGAYNAQEGSQIYRQPLAHVNSLFDGLDVVSPGVVDVAVWRPEPGQAPPAKRTAMILGGVGHMAAR
jgi:hypothetical protein